MIISEAINNHINTVRLARSNNTARTYLNALNYFQITLQAVGMNPNTASIEELTEDAIIWFASSLKKYSPATERLYLTAVSGFYQYLAAERLCAINLPRLRLLIKQRARRQGLRLPQFPDSAIRQVIEYVEALPSKPVEDHDEQLRNLRDSAFILTLADTGLRVHEACALRRGDIDWYENKALIVGKGDKQAIIRFSTRSLSSLKRYLSSRTSRDGNSGRPLSSLPLFARHDRGSGKKVQPITTTTGRNIIRRLVNTALGSDYIGLITPHSFRHYFVTTILKSTGGNIKLAQVLARHQNIQVTQRYAHLSDDELDRGYYEIFDN